MKDKGVALLILIGLLIIYFGSKYTPVNDLADAVEEHHKVIAQLIKENN